MKVKVKNNSEGPFGVEKEGGGYVFIGAGEERIVNAANVRGLEARSFLDVEILSGLAPPPASLKEKAAQVGGTFGGFLDRSAPAIIADIPSQSVDQLQSILADEKKGKSRKGLVAAIEAELEARTQ